MKVVNENLEMVDYEELKADEEARSKKVAKKLELAQHKLTINMLLVDLTYDMNKNLHHKMNITIVGFQLGLLLVSLPIRLLFGISSIDIPVITAFGSLLFLLLIGIGNIYSEKALSQAKTQRDKINEILEIMTCESDEKDERTE